MTDANEALRLTRLVHELRRLPRETTWVEFKANMADPEMIGDRISALSNGAALAGKDVGYVLWGIADDTHEVVGTGFNPWAARKGNEELEAWLARMTNPRLALRFYEADIDGKTVVILEIPAARFQPTAFSGRESIRVGSTTRNLKEHIELERQLWRQFDRLPFERQVALADRSASDVLGLLDHVEFFTRLGRPVPTDTATILGALAEDGMIKREDAGHWGVTNLGGILLARDLSTFPGLARKAVRLIVYEGKNRTRTQREVDGRKGYAAGFGGLMEFLTALLPRNEVIGTSERKDVAMYPDLALRELVANALIHQDFTITGTGPMVEVFADRVEVTNPGEPLGDIERLLDQPPRSRNEALAAFMRRINLCEERGSGVDKVVSETERYQLPPPVWEVVSGSSRAILFAHKELREMDRADRVHACYLHASLRHEQRDPMTNTSLRERFGLEEHSAATASRIIREALDAGRIKAYDPDQAKRNARYLPFWA